jgi:hypothetical protein
VIVDAISPLHSLTGCCFPVCNCQKSLLHPLTLAEGKISRAAGILVALLVALRFWIWCAFMRTGAGAKLLEILANIGVLRDRALRCIPVRVGLECLKRALLYQLSYAPTVFSI